MPRARRSTPKPKPKRESTKTVAITLPPDVRAMLNGLQTEIINLMLAAYVSGHNHAADLTRRAQAAATRRAPRAKQRR